MHAELASKQVGLLHELLPAAARFASLSARQHLDQTIQIFLPIEERLHQHSFVFAVPHDAL
jgi:hypothetical protein